MLNLNSIIDIVVDFIYPPRCAACDKILKENEIFAGFCGTCRSIICLTTGATCMTCGKPLKNPHKEYCNDCLKKDHQFTEGKAVYEYKGIMKDSLYRFKYANRRSYAGTFSKDAVTLHGDWLRRIRPRVIIPVPMYDRKKRVRGYNQAEVFGRYLSDKTNIPCMNDVVIRKKDTKPLKTLNPKERKATLKRAFRETKRFNRKYDVLLVDDIFTTGATVDEVSECLKEAGAGKIYCLFICSGKKDT